MRSRARERDKRQDRCRDEHPENHQPHEHVFHGGLQPRGILAPQSAPNTRRGAFSSLLTPSQTSHFPVPGSRFPVPSPTFLLPPTSSFLPFHNPVPPLPLCPAGSGPDPVRQL